MSIISPRSQLCGHVAAALANHLVAMEGDGKPAHRGDSFWNHGQTDFEAADGALERIGVYLPQKQADGTMQHVFVVDAAEMPDFLAASVDIADDELLELLEAFLRVACGYGELSDGEDWFAAPPAWAIAMRHLAGAGYVDRDGARFRWTEKVVRAMQLAGLWNAEGRSLSDLGDIEFEKEVDLAWKTMPDAFREGVQTSQIGFIEFARVLRDHWKDGAWHEFDPERRVGVSNQIGLARALIERAQAT